MRPKASTGSARADQRAGCPPPPSLRREGRALPSCRDEAAGGSVCPGCGIGAEHWGRGWARRKRRPPRTRIPRLRKRRPGTRRQRHPAIRRRQAIRRPPGYPPPGAYYPPPRLAEPMALNPMGPRCSCAATAGTRGSSSSAGSSGPRLEPRTSCRCAGTPAPSGSAPSARRVVRPGRVTGAGRIAGGSDSLAALEAAGSAKRAGLASRGRACGAGGVCAWAASPRPQRWRQSHNQDGAAARRSWRRTVARVPRVVKMEAAADTGALVSARESCASLRPLMKRVFLMVAAATVLRRRPGPRARRQVAPPLADALRKRLQGEGQAGS